MFTLNDPANHDRLSRLLEHALKLPPRERRAWTAALGPEHAGVKDELERMLAEASAIFFQGSAGNMPALKIDSPRLATENAGPWRLLRKVGEGGMASVWEAERRDGLFCRRVAVKLPLHGWINDGLSERISRERQILARLNHPNIARLLDAGTTAEGRPYLALEYVAGLRIDQYCREHQLSIRQRLRLFLEVVKAISYAHTMLVIHRDLKPSNILVTASGEVRVLDFGIAKALETAKTAETELTRISGVALTPDYASPEQIRREPLTVASDIYSLGVVLYELLTGTRPYRPTRGTRAALEEAVLESEPCAPSEAAGDRDSRNALRGDLDTIILKALKKQFPERYSTADALAEDLERFLQNRPVLARPDSLCYRSSKFFGRHRMPLIAAAIVSILLLTTGAAILVQARSSIMHKQQIAAVRSFLIPMLMEAHAYYGSMKPAAALQLLTQAEQRIDRMQDADPETRVEVMNILAVGLLLDQATAHAEAAARKALAAAEALDAGHEQRLRARLIMGWVLLHRGETTSVRKELDLLIGDMRTSPHTFVEDLAGALRIRSAVAFEEDDAATAEAAALEALKLAESRLGLYHNQSVLALVDLCYAYAAGGKRKLAMNAGQLATSRATSAYSKAWMHPNLLKAREAYAFAVAVAGEGNGALDEIDTIVRDTASVFGDSSRAVGLGLRRLASLQLNAGDPVAAMASIDRAVSILRDHLNPGSPGWARTIGLRDRIRAGSRYSPTPSTIR